MNISNDTRVPQLDSLRAIAVMGVVFSHSMPKENLLNTTFSGVGSIGVRLFFVISGLLITLILMRSSDYTDRNLATVLKTFYIRRALRIFPLYYFSLLVLCLISWDVMRESIFWQLSFTTNIYQTLFDDWTKWTPHYWSLSVEEQFYIFWPILIVYTTANIRITLIGSAIILSQVYKFNIGIDANADLDGLLLLPAQMDSLGLGALIAFLLRYNITISKKYIYYGIYFFLFVGTAAIITDTQAELITYSIVPFILFGIVLLTLKLNNNTFYKFLTLSPILFVGRISFGIYIWHTLVIRVLSNKFSIENSYLLFILAFVFTIFVSSVSWYLLENPINNQKGKFSYAKNNLKTVVINHEK